MIMDQNSLKIILNENDDKKEIDIIKSQTKYEIIQLLNNYEMNFEDIVQNIAKNKSTISMHLKSLKDAGIVEYRLDPEDNRKKIFYLTANVVADINSSKPVHVKENQTKLMIEDFIENGDINYALMLVHAFKSLLEEFAIEIDFILSSIGKYIGMYIFNELYDENFNKFTINIMKYWAENNLGNLTFDLDNTIKIICEDCFECVNLPKSGNSSCFLHKGMFETILSEFFNLPINIIEVQCYCMSDDRCIFEVEMPKLNQKN